MQMPKTQLDRAISPPERVSGSTVAVKATAWRVDAGNGDASAEKATGSCVQPAGTGRAELQLP